MEEVNSSTPKKQHYVPQFILKHFKSGKKKRIHVFDKHKKHSFPSSIRDAASENGFYNIDINNVGYTLESKLGSLETVTSKVISKIIRHESLSVLSEDDFLALCLFCSVQFIRTNKQRDAIKQQQNLANNWLKKNGYNIDQVENFKLLNDSEIKRCHIETINREAIKLSKHFYNKEILLKKSPAGIEFVISDNPITMHNHYPREGRGNLGLALDGIEAHMPISNKLGITFICPNLINEIRIKIEKSEFLIKSGVRLPYDMLDEHEIINSIESGNTLELKAENMEFLNSLQVIQSSRFIYCANGDFSLVIDMLKTNPECMYAPELVSN